MIIIKEITIFNVTSIPTLRINASYINDVKWHHPPQGSPLYIIDLPPLSAFVNVVISYLKHYVNCSLNVFARLIGGGEITKW